MTAPSELGMAIVQQHPPIADWLEALSHDSPFERPQAHAARVGTSPPLAAVPSLLSLLEDDNRDIRLQAITALGDLAGEVRRVLPVLRAALREAALHDGDDAVRAEAIHALLRAGPQPATRVAALVDALHSEVDVVRFHAAISLGDLGSEGRPAVAALIHTSLWDEDPAVRVEAAMALWKIDRKLPLVLHVLVKALEDTNELICWIAVERLGQLGSAARQAIPVLRQTLQRNFRVTLIKKAVVLALERIDPQAAVGVY
ncbi:MAG TPA: HEAT repeat domain-containing protein [Gemmataceae bacterium]|jgi:HEAT repeat protein